MSQMNTRGNKPLYVYVLTFWQLSWRMFINLVCLSAVCPRSISLKYSQIAMKWIGIYYGMFILKMKCTTFIDRLQGRSEFHCIIAYGRNILQCTLILHYFKQSIYIYIYYWGVLQDLIIEQSMHGIYRVFARTHKNIWLWTIIERKNTNNNWTVKAYKQQLLEIHF